MAERRGPVRLDDAAMAAFIATVRWGSLAFEAENDGLCAVPARLDELVGDDLVLGSALDAAVRAAAQRETPACFVADEFETYEEIRGVIVQGHLELRIASADPRGRVVLRIGRCVGFGFAGTLPPALAGNPPDAATTEGATAS